MEFRKHILQDIVYDDNYGTGSYATRDKEELLLKCTCSCSVLSVEKWNNEEEYYLTFYSYYNRDKSLLARLKRAWKELIGKGSEGNNIILSKEDFKKLKEL